MYCMIQTLLTFCQAVLSASFFFWSSSFISSAILALSFSTIFFFLVRSWNYKNFKYIISSYTSLSGKGSIRSVSSNCLQYCKNYQRAGYKFYNKKILHKIWYCVLALRTHKSPSPSSSIFMLYHHVHCTCTYCENSCWHIVQGWAISDIYFCEERKCEIYSQQKTEACALLRILILQTFVTVQYMFV